MFWKKVNIETEHLSGHFDKKSQYRSNIKLNLIFTNPELISTIMFIIFLDFLMLCAIISNKHGIYKLPHKLLIDLKLRILGNKEILGKSQNFIELQPSAQLTPKMKVLSILPKNCWKYEIAFFPIVSAISHEN